MTSDKSTAVEKTRERDFNKRLERIGWALFLIMIGGIALFPGDLEGAWLVGVGLIFLGMNVARYQNGIKMSGFTLFLGVVALISGLGDMLGVDLPVVPIVLILIGAGMLLRPVLDRE